MAVGVFALGGDERVGLVDEKDAVEGFVDLLVALGAGLAGVLGDQAAAVGFDEVALREDAHGAEDLADDAGDASSCRCRGCRRRPCAG